MNPKIPLDMIVNGNRVQALIEPRRHLVDF